MPLARVRDMVLGFTLLHQFSCFRAKKKKSMLFQSVVSFSNIFSFHCCFFVCACFKKCPVILSFTLGQGNVSDTMLRMIDILKDCNHVEMSFIHMVKVLLKSLLFPSLIFLLSPYSTPFLEILQHMWAFGRRKLQ